MRTEIQGKIVFEFVSVGQQGTHKLLQQLSASYFRVVEVVFGSEKKVDLLRQDFLG